MIPDNHVVACVNSTVYLWYYIISFCDLRSRVSSARRPFLWANQVWLQMHFDLRQENKKVPRSHWSFYFTEKKLPACMHISRGMNRKSRFHLPWNFVNINCLFPVCLFIYFIYLFIYLQSSVLFSGRKRTNTSVFLSPGRKKARKRKIIQLILVERDTNSRGNIQLFLGQGWCSHTTPVFFSFNCQRHAGLTPERNVACITQEPSCFWNLHPLAILCRVLKGAGLASR